MDKWHHGFSIDRLYKEHLLQLAKDRLVIRPKYVDPMGYDVLLVRYTDPHINLRLGLADLEKYQATS